MCPHKILVANRTIKYNTNALLSVRSVIIHVGIVFCCIRTRGTLGDDRLRHEWALKPSRVDTCDS